MDDLTKTHSVSIKSESTVASTEELLSPFPCGYKPVAANAHNPPPSTDAPHPVLCEYCHHPADSHPPKTPETAEEKYKAGSEKSMAEGKEEVKEEEKEVKEETKTEVREPKEEAKEETKPEMKELPKEETFGDDTTTSPVATTPESDKKEKSERHKERRRERHRDDKEKDRKEKPGKDEAKPKDEKAKEEAQDVEVKSKGTDEKDSEQKKSNEGANQLENPVVAAPSGDQKIEGKKEDAKEKTSEAAEPNSMMLPEASRKMSMESLDESTTSSSSTDEDDEDSGVEAADLDEESGEPPRRFIILRRLSNTFPFAKDCLNILDVTDLKEYDGLTEPPMVMVTVEGIVPAPVDRLPQALPPQASVEPL